MPKIEGFWLSPNQFEVVRRMINYIGSGWMTTDDIEANGEIYKDFDPYDTVEKYLIKKKQIVVKKGRERLYKLKQDEETFSKLFNVFYDKSAIKEFAQSNYYKDSSVANQYKVAILAKFFDIDSLGAKHWASSDDEEKAREEYWNLVDETDSEKEGIKIPHSLMKAFIDGKLSDQVIKKYGVKKIFEIFRVYDEISG